jgi:cytochrome c
VIRAARRAATHAALHASALAASVALAAPVRPAAAAPNAERGEAIYARCAACHALATNRVGPKHCGLFGRRAGSLPDFAYSPAMKRSGIVWNAQTLDRFLAAPLKMVPGTAMTYDGVPDAGERADLIAYLQRANRSVECTR